MSTHTTFFGKLIAAIGAFLSHLITGAKDAFNDLPREQQDAIEQGVNISQIIKDGYKQGAEFITQEIAVKMGIPEDVSTQLILTGLKDLGINVTTVQDGLDKLADTIQAGITDNKWNSLWQDLAKSAAQWLSTGSLDWVSLSMGLIEWAFNHFVKSNN